LPPDVLQALIREALEEIIDREAYDATIERERKLAERFRVAVDKIKDA
jgi:hypothetical protein